MPCSPLLKGVKNPLRVLRIISENHILRYSEPSTTFYPLQEKGWVEYATGCWRITNEGYEALSKSDPEEEEDEPMSLTEFFEL